MTDIEIANIAVVNCGCNPIADFADDQPEARVLRVHYPNARDTMLVDREWTVATWRTQLAQDAVAPAFGLSYQYIIPSDVLLVLQVFQADGMTELGDWEREGFRILTDDAGPVYAKVIRRVPEGQFLPGMVQALADYLGHLIAVPLTENRQLKADFLAGYEKKITDAASMDARQGRMQKLRPPALPGRRRLTR